jgi:hypothetical protein
VRALKSALGLTKKEPNMDRSLNLELRREVQQSISRLGDFEWRLAVSRCGLQAGAREIINEVEKLRAPYMEGASSIGSAIYMTGEGWTRVAHESDQAAKRELAKG